MSAARVWKALGPIDLRNVRRDPLLRWIVFYPLLLGVVARWATPPLAGWIERRFGLDVQPHYPLVMSFLLVATPMMAGMVIGFMLLDQRDEGTLEALRVTPMSPSGYLVYRLGLPMLLSAAITLVMVPLAGLVPIGPGALLVSTLAAAPLAPLYALFLAAFSANKVQGFAYSKALGVLLMGPVGAWLLGPPWEWLFGLVPLYWPAKVFWLLDAGETAWAAAALAGGLGYFGLLLWPLVRRFSR